MRTLLAVALLTLAGCPRPVTPPAAPPDAVTGAPAACPVAVTPVSADVCPGRFTVEGLACVRCVGASGCLDAADEVYCVAGGCGDARCAEER
ncbi:MAG: hypothetical protein KGK07_15215 [Chloroflexota bacterium]|nr:hypothetical protein [Chloroflexota bacterium]